MADDTNRPVKVMNGKRFVAAYSKLPFEEGKSETEIPDYKCYQEEDGTYWFVRVGDIDVPWGFGSDVSGYWANGVITVSRKNVDKNSFDGRGLPFVREGDVFYLYECELGDNGFYGFSIYMRERLLNALTRLAKRMTKEDFEKNIGNNGEKTLSGLSEVQDILNEHKLVLKRVILHGIGEDKKEQ